MSPAVEKWLKLAFFAIPGVIAFAITLPGALEMLGPETVRQLLFYTLQWGPGMLVLCALYILTTKFLAKFVESQRDQAIAMTHVASAVERMAERDATERKEIRIALSVMSRKVDELHEQQWGQFFRRAQDVKSIVRNTLREQREAGDA